MQWCFVVSSKTPEPKNERHEGRSFRSELIEGGALIFAETLQLSLSKAGGRAASLNFL